jgi:hypothetical protein
MNGDFARITFDPRLHFSRVLLQQGRVLLEADFNEQSAIHHYFLRTLITDLIGRHWRAGDGFQILPDPNGQDDFTITRGHFYVDGILCDNAADRTYATQPWPWVPEIEKAPPGAGFAVYIECWERHVSALQRPSLREVALGGPDTASRAQIVWQVRIASADWAKSRFGAIQSALTVRLNATTDSTARARIQALIDTLTQSYNAFVDAMASFETQGVNCAALGGMFDVLDLAQPRMRARLAHDASSDDPCAIAADARYRGRENQLYRVEVHAPGPAGTATFKWSRENASVQFAVSTLQPIAYDPGKNTLTVALDTLGHDRRTGLCEGDWVELMSDAIEFASLALPLAQVTGIDRTRREVVLQLSAASPSPELVRFTLLRRWDQASGLDKTGTVAIHESASDSAGWIALERGIEIQFLPGGLYRTGDYWLIAARVASRNLDWPVDADGHPLGVTPDGIVRHRAAIGAAEKIDNQWIFATCGCSMFPLCADANDVRNR